MSLTKSHQTAVFVRTNPNASAKHVERSGRFVESLNQPGNSLPGTIKADVYSVHPDGKVYSGLVHSPGPLLNGTLIGVDSPSLRAAAKEAGYALTVVVDSTETDVYDYTAVEDADYGYDDDDDYDDEDSYDDEFNPFSAPVNAQSDEAPEVSDVDAALASALFDVLFPAPQAVELEGGSAVTINIDTVNVILPPTVA